MTLFNVEYAQLFRQWVRNGFVSPAATDTAFTGQTVTIASAMCLIGVAEDLIYTKRLLQPAQSRWGRAPFWDGTAAVGKSSRWEATSTGSAVTITLHPKDATGNYIARAILYPAYATDPSTTIDLPYGGDERLVLGAVTRAHLKDSTRSAAVAALLVKADEEIGLTAAGAVDPDGPRVRRIPQHPFRRGVIPRDRFGANAWPTTPSDWWWC